MNRGMNSCSLRNAPLQGPYSCVLSRLVYTELVFEILIERVWNVFLDPSPLYLPSPTQGSIVQRHTGMKHITTNCLLHNLHNYIQRRSMFAYSVVYASHRLAADCIHFEFVPFCLWKLYVGGTHCQFAIILLPLSFLSRLLIQSVCFATWVSVFLDFMHNIYIFFFSFYANDDK